MISRLGSEYTMPPEPITIPSSTARVDDVQAGLRSACWIAWMDYRPACDGRRVAAN